MKITELKLKHYLNEAIRGVLEEEKIKLKDHVSLDTGLEHDYTELFDLFVKHIELIKKVNEGMKNE